MNRVDTQVPVRQTPVHHHKPQFLQPRNHSGILTVVDVHEHFLPLVAQEHLVRRYYVAVDLALLRRRRRVNLLRIQYLSSVILVVLEGQHLVLPHRFQAK